MSRWFRVYDELLDDPKVQRLSPSQFREEFYNALAGRDSVFADFIDGPYSRPPAHEWALIRAEVFDRDSYQCQYCGRSGGKLECDHVIPVASGGTHDLDNLKTACKACNRSKGAKSFEEWRA